MNICKLQNIDTGRILRSGFEEVEIETTGNSMLPLFGDGSTLTIKFIEPHNIRIGDIIIFKAKEFLVSHRAIKKVTSQ
ncbi:hypothetical protein KKB18_12900, partial [bacterium]|nr:hypothetical protein [bacterium]